MGLRNFLLAVLAALLPVAMVSAQSEDVGYRDFYYGTTGNATPTQQKPESKLWWNDGFWWGSLLNPVTVKYHIYKLDLPTQVWIDTGIALDSRASSLADTLWDGQHLYVVSHIYTTDAAVTSSSSWARLYRYSYDTGTRTYSLDAGFPVNITRGKSETLTVAKDSTGKLWVTYVESGKVMINCSNGDDKVWGVPFVLPIGTPSVNVTTDDISSVIAFQGNKIGVMWSNQVDFKTYFAVHIDGTPTNVWQPEEVAVPGPSSPDNNTDDHLNMKTDSSGRLFVAVKTSLTAPTAPLAMLLVRDLTGNWSNYVFGLQANHHTRPIVVLDEEHGRIYMFATSDEDGGAIYYKTTDINNIQFAPGLGTPFIMSTQGVSINDATSTKQSVNSTTGLVVLASNIDTRFYFHNYLSLAEITDPPDMTIDDVTLNEGASGTTNATFTISLSARVAAPVTVDYATADNTAVAPGDYSGRSGTLTIPAGSLSATITVPVAGNLTLEGDETFFLNLTNAANAVITRAQGTGTITNDDVPPNLSINDVNLTEGVSGTKNFNFTAALSAASGLPVTVDYATADNTAVAPGDYSGRSGTLTIPAGSLSATVTVLVVGDRNAEPDETFFLNLTNAANAVITRAQGLGTIRNDDTGPTISVNDVSTVEGTSGTKNFTFTATLSFAINTPVTVDYATADGTALAPQDYTSVSGTLTIPAGSLSATAAVPVVGERNIEADETFFVNISNAANATILKGQGVGTIRNDDAPPTLSINDVSTTEGTSGTKNFTFTATLSFAISTPVTVDYATADNTAVAPGDYSGRSGTLTIPAGGRTASVAVPVVGDRDVESNETFSVNLTNPTNATILKGQGVGTINNDDAPPTLSINDVSTTEGNTGTKNFTFTATLSFAINTPVTVDYATANGTGITPDDYTSVSGTATIPAGARTVTIVVPVVGERIIEENETFFVNLTNAVGATILKAQGVGTMNNDDTPGMSINDITLAEGNAGTKNFTFTITLSFAINAPVTVDYATANGTGITPDDYTSVSGTATIPAGARTVTIVVPVVGDTIIEGNETFFVNLTNVAGAIITKAQGIGTITNDDI